MMTFGISRCYPHVNDAMCKSKAIYMNTFTIQYWRAAPDPVLQAVLSASERGLPDDTLETLAHCFSTTEPDSDVPVHLNGW